MARKLPPYFRQVLWSYDLDQLDAEKARKLIVVDTINYGSWRHWKWLFGTYGKKTLKKIVEAVPASEFRPGALRLASVLLSIEKQNYASRGAYARRA